MRLCQNIIDVMLSWNDIVIRHSIIKHRHHGIVVMMIVIQVAAQVIRVVGGLVARMILAVGVQVHRVVVIVVVGDLAPHIVAIVVDTIRVVRAVIVGVMIHLVHQVHQTQGGGNEYIRERRFRFYYD